MFWHEACYLHTNMTKEKWKSCFILAMLFWEHVGQSLKTNLEDTSHCKLQIVIFAETISHLLKNETKSYSAIKAASNNNKKLRAITMMGKNQTLLMNSLKNSQHSWVRLEVLNLRIYFSRLWTFRSEVQKSRYSLSSLWAEELGVFQN